MAKTTENLNEFMDSLAPKFTPEPWYNDAGDCIHYHWRNDEYYRDWMDDKLTVYRSIATHEAVGCQIKGVSVLQKKLGEFGISINEKNGFPLAIFLFVSHVSADTIDEKIVDREKMYRYIMGLVKDEKVEGLPKQNEPMALA